MKATPVTPAPTVIRAYDVNVPFMQLERHGWDIHIVSAEPALGVGRESLVTAAIQESAGAPRGGHEVAAQDQLKLRGAVVEQHKRGIHAHEGDAGRRRRRTRHGRRAGTASFGNGPRGRRAVSRQTGPNGPRTQRPRGRRSRTGRRAPAAGAAGCSGIPGPPARRERRRVVVADQDAVQVGRSEQVQHGQVGLAVPAVGGRVDEPAAVAGPEHVPGPAVTANAARGSAGPASESIRSITASTSRPSLHPARRNPSPS